MVGSWGCHCWGVEGEIFAGTDTGAVVLASATAESALALAAEPAHSPPETPNASAHAPAAHARVAHALCASATDLAGVMEARRHATAAIAAASAMGEESNNFLGWP